jgi:DNA-binding transcriptional ArsR family regulator
MAYAEVLEALADPTRREIFERLRQGESPVGQLAEGMPVSRPAVSQHLKVLKEAGLVTERKDGTRRFYSVDREGLAELRDYLEGFWEDVLANFAVHLERQTKSGGPETKDTDK